MRQISRGTITALGPDDVKRIGRFTGITTYRDVLVFWDEDDDTRVLDMIDIMEPWDRCHLIAVHEHEGTVDLFWNAPTVPQQFKNGFDTPDGDHWSAENYLLKAKSE